MMRLFVVGCGVVWCGVAFGQGSVSVYPPNQMPPQAMPQPAPMMSAATQPLPQLVATGVHTPTAGCTTGVCPTCQQRTRPGRPCLKRVFDWLTFQPCPRVLPVLTPTPYQAPLRAYFPCKPDACHMGAAGCSTQGCRGNLLPRLHGAPGSCASCPAPRVSLVARFLRFFDPCPYPYGECGGGNCPCPPTGTYRYAAPCTSPPPSSPYQQGAVQMMYAPAANRPFTAP